MPPAREGDGYSSPRDKTPSPCRHNRYDTGLADVVTEAQHLRMRRPRESAFGCGHYAVGGGHCTYGCGDATARRHTPHFAGRCVSDVFAFAPIIHVACSSCVESVRGDALRQHQGDLRRRRQAWMMKTRRRSTCCERRRCTRRRGSGRGPRHPDGHAGHVVVLSEHGLRGALP